MRLDEPVSIEAYNPAWPAFFQAERPYIQQMFKDAHIEHFGSTAVVGMTAKPIIDIMTMAGKSRTAASFNAAGL